MTHHSAAKTVKQLLGDDLVRAEPHPHDGRKLLLHITDLGRARLQRERAQPASRRSMAAASEATRPVRVQLASVRGEHRRLRRPPPTSP
ncbi:hypothetical protein [Nonomuraea sp. NPDC052265]|uniref:hypothetical protein n=1 Tax=Nonomuraea sp. NPDC052265 TaxID=3364374 RepID=UPI0037C8EEEB